MFCLGRRFLIVRTWICTDPNENKIELKIKFKNHKLIRLMWNSAIFFPFSSSQFHVNYELTPHRIESWKQCNYDFINSRYFRRFLIGDGGFLRQILTGAWRNWLIIWPVRRRWSRYRFNRTGLNLLQQFVVGGFGDKIPADVAEPITGIIDAGSPVWVADELFGRCSVFVFHTWITSENYIVWSTVTIEGANLKVILMEKWILWKFIENKWIFWRERERY